MSICYKTFKTPLAYYVYDRHTNKILKITKEDYEKINSKRADDTFWKKFQNKGYLLENRVEEIEHPDTAMLSHTLNEKMEYLLLQLHKNATYVVIIAYMVEIMKQGYILI